MGDTIEGTRGQGDTVTRGTSSGGELACAQHAKGHVGKGRGIDPDAAVGLNLSDTVT